MLIEFEFENFLSYDRKTIFTMEATKGSKLSNHINNKNRILPIAAVFGGNASGKSNFIKAIEFSRDVILGIESDFNNFYNLRFRGGHTNNNIGIFKYKFCIENKVYSYLLKYDYLNKEILYEELIDEKKHFSIYLRNENRDIYYAEKMLIQSEKKRLNFYIEDFQNEKQSTSFLSYIALKASTKSVFFDYINKAFTFFTNIIIIKPTSKFIPINLLFSEKNIKNTLYNYGLNIENIAQKEVPLSSIIDIDNEDSRKNILEHIKFSQMKEYSIIHNDIPYIFKLDETGNLKAFKIFFVHSNEELFEYEEESDGTKRILDLLPITYMMNKEYRIILVDEIDRSLSVHMSYNFLKTFIQEIENMTIDGQLIFTTHNIQFLDFNLLRKDEIWFVENEREDLGSSLTKFSNISFRTDMDLKTAFWKGKVGGVSKRLINNMKKCA